MTDDVKRDWRGTPITEGATVVYGASVGRSVALVEGSVTGFTPSGRVWVYVIRRAYGGGWGDEAPKVHVGADRLTVVSSLPVSDVPTQPELSVHKRAKFTDLEDGVSEISCACGVAYTFPSVRDRYHAIFAAQAQHIKDMREAA